MAADVPHFAYPFRRDSHGLPVVVEEDSDDEILDCVEVLLRTERGSREEIPEYGIPDQVFIMGGADKTAIQATIRRWEPRASVFLERDDPTIPAMIDTVRINVLGRDI